MIITKEDAVLINGRLVYAITEKDRALYSAVHSMLNKVSSIQQRERFFYDCHSICRCLSACIPELRVVDGVYLSLSAQQGAGGFMLQLTQTTAHSWLETPDEAIIDPFPVGFITTSPMMMPKRGSTNETAAGLYVTKGKLDPDLIRQAERQGAIIESFIRSSMEI